MMRLAYQRIQLFTVSSLTHLLDQKESIMTKRKRVIHWQRYPLYLPMCYHPNDSEVDPDKVLITPHRSNVTCRKCERIMAREQLTKRSN